MYAVACGTAVPSALGDDAGVNDGGPADITNRFVWVTRTYVCDRDTVTWPADPNVVGFPWPEMAAESVRAVHIMQTKDGEPASPLYVEWKVREGFLDHGRPCDGETFIVTLGLELPE